MNDTTGFYLIGLFSGALTGLFIAAYFCRRWQESEARAASWERQARQLAQAMPMPPMRLIECAGHPVLWPVDAPEPEGEIEWPEDLGEIR